MKKFLTLFIVIQILLITAFVLVPDSVGAQTTTTSTGEVVWLFNPLGFKGLETPEQLVIAAFAGFAAIIAFVAIAFVVFSGFKLAIATNEEAVKSARQSLTWAVGGFVVALLTFTIIAGSAKLIGFDPSKVSLANDTEIANPINIGTPEDSGNFVEVMFFVMRGILGLLGFAITLLIIYYGFRYITSAGNEEAVEQAKSGLKWTIAGLVVSLLAYTIITAIRNLLVF